MTRAPWILFLLLSLNAQAQEGRRHFLVGPGIHGFETGFVDPVSGRTGQWVGENALVADPLRQVEVPVRTVGPADLSVEFHPQFRPGLKLRYLVRLSDNLVLAARPEERPDSSGEGLRLSVPARLKDARTGLVAVYFWSYSGSEIVGYGRTLALVLPSTMEAPADPAAKAEHEIARLQSWDSGIGNW